MTEIIKYEEFRNFLNDYIFEKSKIKLLKSISDTPERYVGIFRPTKPKGKILQNLFQSHEIKFGDAMEIIIERYLTLKKCEQLEKKYTHIDGSKLNIDQCFRNNNVIYVVEQKLRDDHDSSKIRGQVLNFEKKLSTLQSNYPNERIEGVMYFIDPDLKKNTNYYLDVFKKISSDYKTEVNLFYGSEFFDYLNFSDVWEEIIEHLTKWREGIPELPKINFDSAPKSSFEEIKNMSPADYRRLFDNYEALVDIYRILFPKCATLRLLYDYFLKQEAEIYKTLAEKLDKVIKYMTTIVTN